MPFTTRRLLLIVTLWAVEAELILHSRLPFVGATALVLGSLLVGVPAIGWCDRLNTAGYYNLAFVLLMCLFVLLVFVIAGIAMRCEADFAGRAAS